ncbi:aKG-HExxH-type peptide beta-hydroxylase [Streptomyces sp. NPDC003393]
MTHERPAAAAAAPPLTLPPDLWRQIARGTPDAGTLSVLRTARAGRNLLLLRAAHQASRTTPEDGGRDCGTGISAPSALLAAVRQRAPAVFEALVTDPAAGVLLADAVRGGRRDPVAVLAAVAAHRAGMSFRLELPVRHGAVDLPGLGRATLEPAAATAYVTRDSHGTTTVTVPGTPTAVRIPDSPNLSHPRDPQDMQDVLLPSDPAAEPAPGWEPAPHILLPARRPGPTPVIRLDAHGPLDVDTPRPLRAHEVARWRDRLGAAWELLAARHPDRADAVRGTVRAVVPLGPLPPGPPGGTRGAWLSASFSDAYGLVALAPLDDPADLAAALVHETQHSLLYALQDLTRLLDAPPGARGYAPWSDGPRPPSALFQGAAAFLATAGFWRREAVLGHPVARAPYQRWRRTARVACDELERGGWLTDTGHRLLHALRDVLAEWDDGPGTGMWDNA